MLSAGGSTDASKIFRVRSGWKKVMELLHLLTSRVFSHKMKRKLYTARIRSDMLYGSKVWPLKESDISSISQTDMQMVRWMCKVSLRDSKSSLELKKGWVLPI